MSNLWSADCVCVCVLVQGAGSWKGIPGGEGKVGTVWTQMLGLCSLIG